jgi:hypothetical protein
MNRLNVPDKTQWSVLAQFFLSGFPKVILAEQGSTPDNKRFCEMAVEVIIQMTMKRFTFCDNPNCLQLNRHFAKPPTVVGKPPNSQWTKT